jgi:hypothetical protein
MRRLASFVVVAVLVGGAFAAGYLTRERPRLDDRPALAQQPQASPPASPNSSPSSGGQGKNRSGGGGKNFIFAVVDSVQGNQVRVTVRDARGGSIQQGSTMTLDVGSGVEIMRQIGVADLRKGDMLAIRGTVEGGRLVASGIRVERQ